MTWRDVLGSVVLVASGIAGGMAIGTTSAVILGIIGAVLGGFVAAARIRWAVALPVIVGTVSGAVLGWAVTHTFCRPEGCPVQETAAATITGIGSLIGVGLVVALAARSFDEYQQTRPGYQPPDDTEPG